MKFTAVLFCLVFYNSAFSKECSNFLSAWQISSVRTHKEFEKGKFISWSQNYRRGKSFYFYGDLDEDGILSLSIQLKDYASKTRSSLLGHQLYKKTIRFFGKRNIKAIETMWTDESDNFKSFREAILSGLTDKEAVLKTWTGQQALATKFLKI